MALVPLNRGPNSLKEVGDPGGDVPNSFLCSNFQAKLGKKSRITEPVPSYGGCEITYVIFEGLVRARKAKAELKLALGTSRSP